MSLLRNQWYAAAWAEEVGRTLLSRTLLNEPVLLYRRENGEPVAIGDTCPHRFAPLNKGELLGDVVQCPYHGLQFGSDGHCVKNPHGDGKIPAAAKVRAYPLVERDTLVWIWMGDQGLADPDKIPSFPDLNDKERFAITAGHVLTMSLKCDLVIDNLLDLTHAAYLHRNNLGSEAVSRGKMTVNQSGNTLQIDNFYPNGLPAPVFVATGACLPDQYVDYWVNVRWDPPANMYFDAGVTPTGTPKAEGAILSSVQLLTPETETTTHYFWRLFRNFNTDNPGLTAAIEAAVDAAFQTEDEAMVKAVQSRMNGHDLMELKPVLLTTDVGAMRARRILSELREREAVQGLA